jgi:NAD(P)-dependent dehydrogenase (short-subunit alcohol dehydrogenase family)
MTYQPFDLTGKTVLITGGNRGIGLGMATAIANAGANLAIWGTNEDRNKQAIETLGKAGSGKMHAWKVNVADEDQVENGFAEVLEHFGRVDSTFANAGIGNLAGTFADMDTKAYREVLAVNLDGAFFTLRVAARHMVARAKDGDPGGSLVGVASLAATEGAARNQHYSASKAGLTGIIRGIAVEYGRYGIRANSVLPGWIATDMTAGAQGNDKFADKVITRVPAARWGEPEDFGGIAVYLVSDASSFHSGDLFKIDGGYSVF